MGILVKVIIGLLSKNALLIKVSGTFPKVSGTVSGFILRVQILSKLLSRLKSPGVARVTILFIFSGYNDASISAKFPPQQ
jgi:hypothetical protein